MATQTTYQQHLHQSSSPFDTEQGASLFLRSRYLDSEATRLENLAAGIDAKINELQQTAKEYRKKADSMRSGASKLRQQAVKAAKPRRRLSYV